MKKFLKKYRSLTRLGLVLTAALAFCMLGLYSTAFALVGTFQLLEFAMSKRCGVCFNSVLTPEQVKEMDTAVKACGKFVEDHTELFKGVKDLGGADGGFAAIKQLPELFKGEKKRADQLEVDLKKLRKQLAKQVSGSGVRWVGNVPFVTNDCAEHLAATFVIDCARLGEKAMNQLNQNARAHEGLIAKACEFLGVEAKTAMSGTQAPLPTNFVSQITELVYAYGQARQFATVYPLGGGTTKLPRLSAGEDDFGYLGVGTAGMSQAIAEKRVAAELVTFTPNKAGGLIRIPTELEEDTFIQLGQFLARYIARQFAKLEDRTMFIADGTSTYANQTGVGPYCVANNTYLLKLAVGKTKCSDVTIDDLRTLRGKVSAAVLTNMAANGQTSAAYYLHPSFEPFLKSLNKNQLIPVVTVENGVTKIDGWPVRWIGVSAVNDNTAQAEAFATFFGDLSYWYLGERGQTRIEVSKEVFFATDELAMRALERIDTQALAVDAMATLQLGAAA